MAGSQIPNSNGAEAMKRHGGIYFVTTSDSGVGHVENAQAALKGGVRIIQYRNKNGEMPTMLEEARRIKDACRSSGALFIVDDRIDLALAVDADGIHIGEEDMPLKVAKKIFQGKIIGVSAKSVDQAVEAERGGATYLGVGTIFPTKTKVKTRLIGLEGFEAVRKNVSLPVYGIGGLKFGHIKELRRMGADGMAVISAITDAPDMVKAASELVNEWDAQKQ